MSKSSHFSTSIKVFYSLHLLLTILSIGGILYLVFSLRETQNELKHLQESCALCDVENLLKTESETLQSNYESIFKKAGQDSRDVEGQANESRKRRTLRSKGTRNQTCTMMIRDFMKSLEATRKLVCINQFQGYIYWRVVFEYGCYTLNCDLMLYKTHGSDVSLSY
jgi:hypothetical protein